MNPFTGAHAPIGTWLKMAAAEPVEVMAHAGFDFVVVDLEHAPLGLETAYRLVNSATALGMTPFVRVPDHTASTIQKMLDAGARGVLVPKVDTVEVAIAVGRAARFPPAGERGAGGTSRAGRWGLRPNAEYLSDTAWCIPQLESERAVAAAAEILAVDSVDAVFVGVADLSLSMGTTPADPAIDKLVAETLSSAEQAGKPCGLAFGSAAAAADGLRDGAGFVVVSNDTSMLAGTAREIVTDLR